eukprot:6939540-Prymnesium_polylepis.1
MDRGECEAAIVGEDYWRVKMTQPGLDGEPHSASKVALAENLFELSNVIPVRPELEPAISWAMRQAINRGRYEFHKVRAINLYVGGGVLSGGSQEDEDVGSIPFSTGGGPILIGIFCITTSLACFLVREWRRVRRDKDGWSGADKMLGPPTLVERLTRGTLSAEEGAEELKAVAADERSTAYQNRDLTVLSQMLHARHLT